MHRIVASLSLLAMCASRLVAASVDRYATGFEVVEGYSTNADLVGQNGWIGFGSGGNGVVSDFFSGQGQQAYIGFDPPAAGYTNLFVLQPINFSPLVAGQPVVRFTTLMSIEDSTNDEFDYFQWQVYNLAGDQLFVIDFDVFATNVNYFLDGGSEYIDTGVKFGLSTIYTLTITMDFSSNRWSATLNSAVLATNQPITTTARPLTLGDVDAVWDLYDYNSPGDNYMLFDNYKLSASPPSTPPPRPQLSLLGRSGGQTALRLTGATGYLFALEATTNLLSWTALGTNTVQGGSCDYTDTNSATINRRSYRARWVP